MKFVAESDTLSIKFEGAEMLLALKRQLILPRADIEDLRWAAEFFDKDRALRIIGTGMPRLLYAGRYIDLKNHERLFLYLKRPKGLPIPTGFGGENVLIVTMRSGSFRQIIVTCQPEIGASLTSWWRG